MGFASIAARQISPRRFKLLDLKRSRRSFSPTRLGSQVPEQDGTVPVPAGECPSIGRNRQRTDVRVVAGAAQQFLSGGDIPQLERVVAAGRGKGAAVRGK